MRQQLSDIEALAKADRWAEAVDLCTRLIEQSPNVPELYEQRSSLYNKAKDFERAIKDTERVIALVPDAAAPHFRLGRNLMATERYREASESFGNAGALDNGYFGDAVHFYRAEALLRSKDYFGALRACSQITSNYSEQYFFGHKNRTKQDMETEARAGLKRLA